MREDRVLPTILIALGGFWLLRTIGLIPRLRWDLFWPIALIILGIAVISRSQNKPKTRSQEVFVDGKQVTVHEWSEDSSLMKVIAGIVVLFTLGIVTIVLLGVFTPLLILFIPLLPLILFFRFGLVFLGWLIRLALFASPLFLILLILALIF